MSDGCARKTLALYDRTFHDAFAVLIHVASLAAALGSDGRYATSTAGALAVSQEALTIAFHLVYLYNYRYRQLNGNPNLLKWAEYAVTATIGTLAALSTGRRTSPWYLIVFVAVAGIGQQTVGYRIDSGTGAATTSDWLSFSVASALQVAEIIVVWAVRPAWRVAAVYTLGWSAFGVHAGLRLYFRGSSESRWSDVDWTETVYSCMSWAAKVAVFWAVFARGRPAEDLVFGITLPLYIAAVGIALARKRGKPDSNAAAFISF